MIHMSFCVYIYIYICIYVLLLSLVAVSHARGFPNDFDKCSWKDSSRGSHCMYIFIYIYIYRERERNMCVCAYIYIYTYIYIYIYIYGSATLRSARLPGLERNCLARSCT